MKQGRVYYKGIAAGTIREDENGFMELIQAESRTDSCFSTMWITCNEQMLSR